MHFDRLSSAPVVQLMAAAALGLLVAPSVLARDAQNQAPGRQELVWLTLAVLVVGWVVALWPALSRELDRRLGHLPIRSEQTRADVPLLTRLALAAGYVVLVQAILRRPLVLTLGPAFERFVVEAAFAAVMLLLLLGLLVALHRAARRVIAGLAWLALDTAFATSGPSTPLADTPARANGVARQPVATTVAAPSTTIAAQPTRAATEPTLAATQMGNDGQATVVAS